MKVGNGCLNIALVMVLLPIAVGCIVLAAVIWNFDPDRDLTLPEPAPAPDTVSVTDTLYSFSSNFQLVLQHCYFLEICRQSQTVPFEKPARGYGIIDRVANVFTDVTLDMFLSVTVVVYAGIDASEIEILDCEYDEDLDQIGSMLVYLPRAEITYSMVDLSDNFLTHYREGHVRGSMYLITEFLVDACAAAEPRARNVAVASGILEEADRKLEQEIRLLLGSVGVRNVEFMREMPVDGYQVETLTMGGGL